MEYERCYVFRPQDGRPAKRRRTDPQGLHSSWDLRERAYASEWQQQHELIASKLNEINSTTIAGVSTYLDECRDKLYDTRIPAAIILVGPGGRLHASIASEIVRHRKYEKHRAYVSLYSNCGTTLKATLKTLIQKATAHAVEHDVDGDEATSSQRMGGKSLSYDLQILNTYVHEKGITQLVVTFEDTEAFDGTLLSELVQLFGCWRDRIPFACIFNVATSVDFLQQRLAKAATKCLDGRLFEIVSSSDEIERVFDAIAHAGTRLCIGPAFVKLALERQTDYIQGADTFVHAIQYAHMSHYYADALSIFLMSGLKCEDVTGQHFEALRNLPSFRGFARQLLKDKRFTQLRDMLDSDESLYRLVEQKIGVAKTALFDVMVSVDLIRRLQTSLPNALILSRSSLYVQALSGKLRGSSMLRSLILSIRKARSDLAVKLLKAAYESDVPEDLKDEYKMLAQELNELLQAQPETAQPLKSEDDVKNPTLRTTVVARKVELSKQQSSLSEQDSAYTAILRRFTELLERLLADKLIDPSTLVFHEIFMYDLKSPHREVFNPRPRHALERALAAPHDYLDCECCAPGQGEDEATLAACQPPTAVLYQLHLESGNLTNASDLWQAFQAVVEDEKPQEQTMALFQSALAELKYLGLIRMTRKRVDHVAKVAWRGL